MRLLIITQVIDKNNPVLGFMHRWIEKFAEKFEYITVICLEKGKYDLPKNVKVLSLGKEGGRSRLKYLFRFYKYIWQERKNYDAVFVHMNQEYVLLGGKLWMAFGKPVYMWRNHHSGSLLTDIASFFCKKIFCTSKYSYTAKYKKTVLMPIGVDDMFKQQKGIERKSRSILFLGRIAPVKKPDLLIEALFTIKEKDWSATIVGDALPRDAAFYQRLKEKVHSYGIEGKVKFQNGVPNDNVPTIYSAHQIFVNLSSSGMYDKTIVEAAACGCLVLASNQNLHGEIDERHIFTEGDKNELAQKLSVFLAMSDSEMNDVSLGLQPFVQKHCLSSLVDKLALEITI